MFLHLFVLIRNIHVSFRCFWTRHLGLGGYVGWSEITPRLEVVEIQYAKNALANAGKFENISP